MLQSKIFIGSAEKPVDAQFNEWMQQNNDHIVPKNYDFRLSRYSSHALCILYDDTNLDKKEDKDPFTDEPVVKYNVDLDDIIKRYCEVTQFGKHYSEKTEKAAATLLAELTKVCPKKDVCSYKDCIGCDFFNNKCTEIMKKYDMYR